ncbi:hypothetical protein KM043_018120 [Ampulex compressa]|nr:hypothetical protein KM043_018120 [Ampulex compressa]
MSRTGTKLDAKKVNSELFTLSYGALVAQLLKDYENVDDVNKQLERMGYNMGIRLIEDFLARTGSANPLTEFVELPDHCLNLKYCNILTGVLRGACEMVQMEIACWFVQDQLKNDSITELRVKFIKRLEDAIPAGDGNKMMWTE